MFKNYLLLAFRTLRKQWGFSLINFVGLSIGLSISLIVLLFVQFEWSFDQFHSNKENVFRLKRFELFDDGMRQGFSTPYLLKDVIQEEFPQVQKATRLVQSSRPVKLPDQSEDRQALTFVSTEFLEIFDFEMKQGDETALFPDKYDIYLTETVASRYFGDESAIGKTIDLQLQEDFIPFTVRGILEDIPANSSIALEALVSDALYLDLQPEKQLFNWFNVFAETYVLTETPEDKASLEAGMERMMQRFLGDDYKEGTYFFQLYGLGDIHFHTGENPGNILVTNPKMLYILLILGLMVMVLGAVNFTTMAIGRAVVRAKEVGVRKSMGAERKQLAFQFVLESMVVIGCSFLIAIVLAMLILPEFNTLFNKTLSLDFNWNQIVLMLFLLLLLTVMSASFPAIYMSGMKAIHVLKGNFSVSFGKQNLRKGLVGFQFFLSFLIITCTLVMVNQMNLLRTHDLGIQTEQVFVVPVSAVSPGNLGSMLKFSFDKANIFRERMLERTDVSNAALTVSLFGNDDWWEAGFTNADEKQFSFNLNLVVGDYLGTMGIQLAEGRNFYENITLDSGSIIVNKTFAEQIGWNGLEDASLPASANFGTHEIIGITEDFNHASLFENIGPVLISKNPKLIFDGIDDIMITRSQAMVLIKANTSDTEAFVATLKEEYEKVYPGENFVFYPFDEFVFDAYINEERLSKMVSYTAGLAVLIAIMGLIALTAMAVSGRIKEIGIRKVLGASTFSISMLFSKEFLIVTFIGMVLAIPLGIFIMRDWLNQFTVREWPSVGSMVFAVMAGALMTLLLVSLQAVSASRINPVNTLKGE